MEINCSDKTAGEGRAFGRRTDTPTRSKGPWVRNRNRKCIEDAPQHEGSTFLPLRWWTDSASWTGLKSIYSVSSSVVLASFPFSHHELWSVSLDGRWPGTPLCLDRASPGLLDSSGRVNTKCQLWDGPKASKKKIWPPEAMTEWLTIRCQVNNGKENLYFWYARNKNSHLSIR